MSRGWLLVLSAAAANVWLRDRRWMAAWADTLPVLAALPLAAWLGRPWRLQRADGLAAVPAAAGSALFLAGAVCGVTALAALGWTLLLWAWLAPRLGDDARPAARRLMALVVLGFPWVVLDAQFVGFWFRWTGAWCAEHVFAAAGLDTVRHGTDLVVDGLAISVGAPCDGLNVLQALLVVGTATVYVHQGDRPRFWAYLPLLPLLAWAANTLRISAVGAAALSWGAEFAMGAFHDIGGLFVLGAMFLAGWVVCARRPEGRAA